MFVVRVVDGTSVKQASVNYGKLVKRNFLKTHVGLLTDICAKKTFAEHLLGHNTGNWYADGKKKESICGKKKIGKTRHLNER